MIVAARQPLACKILLFGTSAPGPPKLQCSQIGIGLLETLIQWPREVYSKALGCVSAAWSVMGLEAGSLFFLDCTLREIKILIECFIKWSCR